MKITVVLWFLHFGDINSCVFYFFLGYYFTASRLRHFSDVNVGISIPGRRETSDLLNVDGDKNDYDWWDIFLMFIFHLLNTLCTVMNYIFLILTVFFISHE
jgi:hypothetical protein